MKKITLISVLTLIFVVAISFFWNIVSENNNRKALALQTAKSFFRLIVHTRSWNAQHGGVYVPVSQHASPNPYLKTPLRDLTAEKDFRLTMINPAYMTRQISEIAAKQSGVQFHITSLKPIRPENKSTEWEAIWLQSFENGKGEQYAFVESEQGQQFRYMAPLLVEESCLKCHATQGYEKGDIRGGISVTIPHLKKQSIWGLLISHLLVILAGLLLIIVSRKLMMREKSMLILANNNLEHESNDHKATVEKLLEAKSAVKLNEERLESLLKLNEMKNVSESDIIQHILEEGVRLTRSEIGYYHLIKDNQVDLELYSWSKKTRQSCPIKDSSSHIYPLDSAGIWADSIRTGQPVCHNDYQHEPERKGYPDGHMPIKSHMSVPIFEEGQMIAIVGVGNKEEPYDNVDIRQLTLLSESGWRLIYKIRSEEEKKKLQKDLQNAKKMQAVGTLAGGIAHEFNNLLGVIMGCTDMARDDVPKDSFAKNQLDNVMTASYRVKDLVKKILTFSRQGQQKKISLSFAPLVRESLRLIESSIPSSVEVRKNIDSGCGNTVVDPTEIQQIVMNLSSNAVWAMQESGTIEINLNQVHLTAKECSLLGLPEDIYIKLSFADNGQGMDSETKSRIFDPFYTEKEVGSGTGMGLSIVYAIMESYKGTITVESDVGKGTTFHLYFPISGEPTQQKPENLETIPTGDERILFVDDDDVYAEMGAEMIGRLGYDVDMRKSSREALNVFKIAPENYDLVITDQVMPDLSGEELVKEIRTIRPGMPIILCTGYSSQMDEQKAGILGIDKFVYKPIVKKDIALLIRNVLDGV
jgi:signal transduction histidine kinase/CheY-like chemotaxis protein